MCRFVQINLFEKAWFIATEARENQDEQQLGPTVGHLTPAA
jgi:hypothetical protein